MTQILFTIGHSNRKWSDFISILKHNNVDLLVDVRRYPGSRACPQFNSEQMTTKLHEENVSYIHIDKLGGRRNTLNRKQDGYNNSGWKNKSFMTTTSFREGINELLSLMQKYSNLSIMCAEAVPWRCHRRMIADYLIIAQGIGVFDILDSKQQPAPHELTSFARLTENKIITYPEKM
jgi:uncharacterized protein (DUF488 family)